MATKHWHDTSRDSYLNTNRTSDHVEASDILIQADDRQKWTFAYQEVTAHKAKLQTKLKDMLPQPEKDKKGTFEVVKGLVNVFGLFKEKVADTSSRQVANVRKEGQSIKQNERPNNGRSGR